MLVHLTRSNNILSLVIVPLLFSYGKSQFKYDREIAFPNNYTINMFRTPKKEHLILPFDFGLQKG